VIWMMKGSVGVENRRLAVQNEGPRASHRLRRHWPIATRGEPVAEVNALLTQTARSAGDECAVFFSRCRPQDADPIDIVLRERRIFFGWPAWREGVEPRRGHLREALVDFWCPESDWAALYTGFGNAGLSKERRHYQQNRNFVRGIKPGAIALVPRPSRGVVYAGRVTTPFGVLDDPAWGEEYLHLRREQGLDAEDEFSHLGDVAQCCAVDRLRALPFSLIPAWIRRSLLGRSTYGRIWPLSDHGLDPYNALDTLLDNPEHIERFWTQDVEEVGRRLLDAVGPNTFEHLCVALLQLENPQQVWIHVGGSGDGGIDGMGADGNGTVGGLLQCKWAYWGEDVFVDHQAARTGIHQILAAILHADGVRVREDIEFWPRRHIASLVLKHADRLPLALTLRIKTHGKHLI
jgi:hypothetical protein